jgi:polar amino acid transport system substrate-binding protein
VAACDNAADVAYQRGTGAPVLDDTPYPGTRPLRIRTVASLLLPILSFLLPTPASAEPVIPYFWDAKERLPKPDLGAVSRVRFLTTVDFPPFNFLDRSGRLTGFHIDLVRAMCNELGIVERCQIQALPWEELGPTVTRGEAEAIVAGLAITPQSRVNYAFSRPFLQFPGRFVTLKSDILSEPLASRLDGQRVGVMAGSGHEKMLREYFPGVKPVTYSRQDWMMDDLRKRSLAAIFGDGMRLGFWLGGTESADCCRFSGGAYLGPEFLGPGLAIAVTKENQELAAAFDFALQQLNTKGIFAELYLRYFPVGFF